MAEKEVVMGFCSKCGKEIDDEREVCADCEKMLDDQGESYLDNLLDSIAPNWNDEFDVYDDDKEIHMPTAKEISDQMAEEQAKEEETTEQSKQEKMDNNEDISELMDLLSQDEKQAKEDNQSEIPLAIEEPTPEPEIPLAVEEPTPEPEIPLATDDTAAIQENAEVISNGTVKELVREPEVDTANKQETTGAKGYDDIFSDALSAISYMEDEQQPEDEPMALTDDMNVHNDLDSEQPINEPAFALDEMSGSATQDFALDETQPEIGPDTVKAEQQDNSDQPEKKMSKLELLKSRFFDNIVNEDIAAAELRSKEEQEQADVRLAEEKKKKKEEEKEKKELKKEQAKEKKELAQKAKEEKLEKKKAEKLAKDAAKLNEVQGKINPIGAGIVFAFFGIICVLVILVTNLGKYSNAMSSGEAYFQQKDYEKAYEAISGVDAKEVDRDEVEKIRICMSIKKEWNSYNNYYKLKMYLEAVDSLIKGVRKCDENSDRIEALSIETNVSEMDNMFIKKLADEYSVTEQQVKELISMTDRVKYTKSLQDIIDQWENDI